MKDNKQGTKPGPDSTSKKYRLGEADATSIANSMKDFTFTGVEGFWKPRFSLSLAWTWKQAMKQLGDKYVGKTEA